MKRAFVKPIAQKYAVNTKENIVSSIIFDNGSFTVSFHTIEVNPNDPNNPYTEKEGCYDVLDLFYRIPESYETQNYANNFYIEKVMANYTAFNQWYTDMTLGEATAAITSCQYN